MRKTFILLLSAAFVASIPSVASAKKMKRHKHRVAAVQVEPKSFVGDALRQIIVPLEVTLGGRR